MINKIYDKTLKFIKETYKSLIVIIIILLLFLVELPYAIYTPGGKVDLSKRVTVEGGYETKGELDMAYVSMVRSSIPYILLSYVIPNWDLKKVSDVTYDNMTMDETIEIDKIAMQEGINNAIISAYKEANKEVKIKDEKLKVMYVDKDSKSNLNIGDEILTINDIKVRNIDEIKEIIKDKNIKNELTVKIKRNNKTKIVKSKLIKLDNEIKLGIATTTLYDLETNPKVSVKTKSSESGSSGGLMTSLAIYNSLVRQDITNGDIIIGTGTIDENGNVGEIDGIKYKLLGASKKKAKIFLCPQENYKEAIKVKKDNNLKIEVVKVKTLNDAISYLEGRIK